MIVPVISIFRKGKSDVSGKILQTIIPYLTAILELIGVVIILIGAGKTLFSFIRSRFDFGERMVKLELARALALSLEFKLAAEILKTVIIRSLNEFIILAAVVLLRIILTLVIHWEIKKEEGEELTTKHSLAKQNRKGKQDDKDNEDGLAKANDKEQGDHDESFEPSRSS